MREIKFRAWDKKTNQWVYFDLIDNTDRSIFSLVEWSNMPKYQYTGLKDKNGTPIYEGDILFNEADKNPYQEIFWSNFEGAWVLGDEDSYGLSKYRTNTFWQVIGNIYENKDLL